MKVLFIFSILIGVISCGQNNDCLEYYFDERQCAGDPWINAVTGPITDSNKITALTQYLEKEGISVKKISINPNFHEFVCEACFVCPQGPRYYLSIEPSSEATLLKLDLLNLGISP